MPIVARKTNLFHNHQMVQLKQTGVRLDCSSVPDKGNPESQDGRRRRATKFGDMSEDHKILNEE